MDSHDSFQWGRPVPLFILPATLKQHEGRCIYPFHHSETHGHHTVQSAHKTAATALAKGIVIRVIPISRINFLP
jgi:hypothetical protein